MDHSLYIINVDEKEKQKFCLNSRNNERKK